jgi:hypothetical protein
VLLVPWCDVFPLGNAGRSYNKFIAMAALNPYLPEMAIFTLTQAERAKMS